MCVDSWFSKEGVYGTGIQHFYKSAPGPLVRLPNVCKMHTNGLLKWVFESENTII